MCVCVCGGGGMRGEKQGEECDGQVRGEIEG